MSIGIGIVGYGYWGPNLVRNFAANPDTQVIALAEPRESLRNSVIQSYPSVTTYDDAAEMFARDDIDAVAIATPVSSHYWLARQALDSGKHILLEKPMCQSSDEASDLVARAEKVRRVLMVDHTFLFTGAVQKMAEVVRTGGLGTICYFDSMRVNLGLFQPDVNCLWDLAPHDLAIIDHLVKDDVVGMEASGYCHVDPLRPDMVYLTLHYAQKRVAHFNLSWMSPVKIRRFTVGGTEKMMIWDDLDQDQKIKIYDHGIEFQPQEQRAAIIPEYRIGDVLSPRVSRREALAGVVEHFVAVIRSRANSIMDGYHGLRIVRLLEAAERRLSDNLKSVEIARIETARGRDRL